MFVSMISLVRKLITKLSIKLQCTKLYGFPHDEDFVIACAIKLLKMFLLQFIFLSSSRDITFGYWNYWHLAMPTKIISQPHHSPLFLCFYIIQNLLSSGKFLFSPVVENLLIYCSLLPQDHLKWLFSWFSGIWWKQKRIAL